MGTRFTARRARRVWLARLLAGSLALLPAAIAGATVTELGRKTKPAPGAHIDSAHPEDVPTAHGSEHAAAPPINWTDGIDRLPLWRSDKDAYGGSIADEHDSPSNEPQAPPLVWALVNFAIFAGLLVKLAGPRLSAYLAGRHDTIQRDLAEAARLRAEAEKKLAEYSSRMAKVTSEVDQMIGEIRGEAEAEKAQILADARAQAEALRREADERIASEIARARAELEREIVGVAVAAAERVLRERTTASDQQALFERFIDDLVPARPGPGGSPPSGGSPSSGASGGPSDDTVSKGWS